MNCPKKVYPSRKPIEAWNVSEVLKKYQEKNLLSTGSQVSDLEDDEDDFVDGIDDEDQY